MKQRLLTPGPTPVPEEALLDLARPVFYHRSAQFRELLAGVRSVRFMAKRGDYNVFHDFYRDVVQALYDTGATRYVFCVNVDAVIAALLLAVLWKDYRSGALIEKDLETAAFNVFLYGRMIGAAAEIDDHLNRGRNMDTRTPQEQCAFVV